MANVVQIVLQGKDNLSPILRGVSGSLVAMRGQLVTLGVAATAAVTGGLVGLVTSAINTADEMRDLAQRAAMPVEAFSRLAYAAKQSGVPIDALSIGLKTLSKQIGAAIADPTSEAARTFSGLGIILTDANGKALATEAIFKTLADRFSEFDDSAEKVALALKAIPKSGDQLLPLFNESAAGIEKMGARANVVTKEMGDQADAFNDNLSDLKTGFQKVGFVVAEAVLPRLIDFSNQLLETEHNTNAAASAAQFFLDTIRFLVVSLMSVRQMFVQVGSVMGMWWFTVITVVEGLGRIVDLVFTRLERRAAGFMNILRQVVANMGVVGQAMKAVLSGEFKEAGELAMKALKDGLSISVDIGKQISGTATDSLSGIVSAFQQTGIELKAGWKSIFDGMKDEASGFEAFIVRMNSELAPKAIPDLGRKGGGKNAGGSNEPTLLDKQLEEFEKIDELNRRRAESSAQLEGQLKDSVAISYEERLSVIARQHAEENLEIDRTAESFEDSERMKLLSVRRKELAEKALRQDGFRFAAGQLGQAASLAEQFGKEGFIAAKALRIGEAIMGTAAAVVNALAAPVPWPAPLIFAGIAAAMGAVQVGIIGAASYQGQAHGGLDYVPEESTFLLNRGERVLQPQANQDLTAFLEGNGGGGPSQISIYLDGAILGQGIGQLSRDGRLEISARAIAA